MDFTGFPMCRNGDVLIDLSYNSSMQLHSEVLKRHSTFFRARLLESNATELSSEAKEHGICWRWNLNLQQLDGSGIGQLILEDLDQNGRLISPSRCLVAGGRLINPSESVISYWQKVLGAIYSRPFDIDEDSIIDVFNEVLGLIEVAEYIGCVHVLYRTIDSVLVEQGQTLFRSISSDPISWGDLGMRIHSSTIVREAVIHLVGQWNGLAEIKRADIDPKLRVLCQRKHKELDELTKTVELSIGRHYLPQLSHRDLSAPATSTRASSSSTTTANHPPRGVSRAAYASDIWDWMAVGIFRHWFCGVLIHQNNRQAGDGGFALYRKLSNGDYLNQQDMRHFQDRFPLTVRGIRTLEEHLSQLKSKVKELVEPLFENRSHLNVMQYPVGWLTCMKVDKSDVVKLWDEATLRWDRPIPDPSGPEHSFASTSRSKRNRGEYSYRGSGKKIKVEGE